MIDDIMDIAKFEKGVFNLQNEEFSLNMLLEEVKGIFEL